METILNLLPLTDEEQAAFLACAPHEDQIFFPSPKLSLSKISAPPDKLAQATVVLGNVPAQMLAGSTGLKWLQTWSAGVNAYTAPGALPQGAMLTSAVGAYGPAVSEHMLASLLALMKRLPEYRDLQTAHRWIPSGTTLSLRGATVLLLGTGDLGGHFAALVKALGAHTVGLNRHPDTPVASVDELHPLADLDAWLPRADVVAMTLPEAPQTIHLMNAGRLALLKPEAILVNAGRGSAVDCLALAEALRAGRLRGAALDVTEPEPLPADHPLWDCPNLLLTPHVGGGYHLEATLRSIASIALENLRRFLAGEPLRNQVL